MRIGAEKETLPMNTPIIVEALRTPIGRARKGSLVGKDAFDLAQVVEVCGTANAERSSAVRDLWMGP